MNTYYYVGGNPLEYTDESGTEDSGSFSGSLLTEGFKRAEQQTLSQLLYMHTPLFQTDAEQIVKVCIGMQDYFVDNGLDWNPYGLTWSLISDQAKDAAEDKVIDTLVNDPDVRSAANTINSSRQSVGTTIRTWIQNHTPFPTVTQTLSR